MPRVLRTVISKLTLLLLLQIMGVGYYEQLSQWSKGEYAGANNVSANTPAQHFA
jgi:hypothetical protein